MDLSFIEMELWTLEVLHYGNRDFGPFCSCNLDIDLDLMTFIYVLNMGQVHILDTGILDV